MDEYGVAPLYIACAKNNESIVALLIKYKANLDTQGNLGFTYLHNVCGDNNTSMIELLLKAGANPNISADHNFTVMHMACAHNNESIVKLLLDYGANPDVHSTYVSTPLYKACQENNEVIVKLLLDHGAKVDGQENYIPLHVACANNNEKIVQLLLENGADVNAGREIGNIPLYEACANNNETIVRLLIKHQAKINLKNQDGDNSFHKACSEGNEVIIKLLLENGADVNAKNKYGNTPLHIACKGSNYDIVKCLLKPGADINAKNERGNTPLYIACDTSLLDTLLNDHDMRNQHILYQTKHDNIIKILLRVGANIDDDRILNNPIIKQAKLIDDLFVKQEHIEQNTFFDVSMLDMLIFRFNHILKVKIKTDEINNDKMYLLQHNLKNISQDSENILDKLFENSPLKIIYTNLDNFMESSALPLKHSIAQKISCDISKNIPIYFSILPVDMIDLVKVWQSNFTLLGEGFVSHDDQSS